LAFIERNRGIVWLDVTGGEIFLRQDIELILEAVLCSWPRLVLVHFPTNGFQTDRIAGVVDRLSRHRQTAIVVTVSVDGPPALNDEIRGASGGFDRQMATLKALRRIPGVRTVLGMTLSRWNVDQVDETLAACRRAVPDLQPADIHVNLAQVSAHYYGNADAPPFRAEPDAEIAALRRVRAAQSPPRSLGALVERVYLKDAERFASSGVTPMSCHALRASCFVDPQGVVFPCLSDDRVVGRLRDSGMRLDSLWQAATARSLQQEIWNGRCPQCWTACDAHPTLLANALVFRRS
jgi:MoaA/NifB/PqqE/SkfB family radical SAM enzyme